MRIKVIGENNCARATRHLLRLAGFAVTEFLPAEAITRAPHFGFVITIELAPAIHATPAYVPNMGTAAGLPSPTPDLPTHARPATTQGEAPAIANDAGVSSPSFARVLAGGERVPGEAAVREGALDVAVRETTLGEVTTGDRLRGEVAQREDAQREVATGERRLGEVAAEDCVRGDAVRERTTGEVTVGDRGRGDVSIRHAVRGDIAVCERTQAEACATHAAGASGGHIHFDSVDGALEAAVLRHVTRLAAAPVIVDRPGGVVHSERELRIVVPCTGDTKADEAAAAAVEFGVLRGLLDLVTPLAPTALAGECGTTPSGSGGGGARKWWTLFRRGMLRASERFLSSSAEARADRTRRMLLMVAALAAFMGSVQASPRRVIEARGVDGAYLHLEATLAAAPAQGQFADGQMNIGLIGGAAVSSSLYDSGNTALKVNCVVGCSATSGFSDSAAFNAGTTAVNNISAVFNDSITALTSGDAGALRSTTDRMLYVNVGKLGGTALSGANVVDSGNIAFRVNCVVGCSASAGFADNSAFTAGTTTESNLGGVFNDGLTTLSSGNAAAARITSARGIHVNLRNSSGTEIGTPTSPVTVQSMGNAAVLSGQQAVTASAAALSANAVKTVCIKALSGNTVNVYVGPSGVTDTTGMELAPGNSYCAPATNTNLFYVIAATTGASISWVASN